MKRGIEHEEKETKKRKVDPQSAFSNAIINDEFKKVAELIGSGEVDVNYDDKGVTPLILAINSSGPNRAQIIRTLLSAGANSGLEAKGRLRNFIDKVKSFVPFSIFSSKPSAPSAIEVALRNNDEAAVEALQTKSLTGSPFMSLPNELFDEILQHLPTYSFVGDKSIYQVCHFWNSLIEKRPIVKTPETILSPCNSRAEALNILRDDGLCRHLMLTELLTVVRWVPEVAEYLVKNHRGKFSMEETALLAGKNLSLARWVIQCETSSYDISFYDRRRRVAFMLAQYNLQSAQELLAEFLDKYLIRNVYFDYINSENLYNIAQHPELVEYILTTPPYCELLRGPELSRLGIKHGISFRILDTPEFAARLENDDLRKFGKHQLALAHHILNNTKLAPKVDSFTLESWAVKYPEIADRIFENPLLRDEMGDVTKEEIEGRRAEKAERGPFPFSEIFVPFDNVSILLVEQIYAIVTQQVAKIPKEHEAESKSLGFFG